MKFVLYRYFRIIEDSIRSIIDKTKTETQREKRWQRISSEERNDDASSQKSSVAVSKKKKGADMQRDGEKSKADVPDVFSRESKRLKKQ